MEFLFNTVSSDNFQKVCQKVFNHLCGTNENLNNTISSASQELKQLIIDCNFDVDEVAAVIKTKSQDQDKIEHFLTMLQERRIDLLYALLTHGNSSHGETITNFNWVLKLVLGSSELKSLKYPLMQLMLNTETTGNKGQKIYELNKETLNKVIHVLENVE